MTDHVANLKRAANDADGRMGVPDCRTCAHHRNIFGGLGEDCALTGFSVGRARRYPDECGPYARYWTPKPKRWWQRLFDMIGGKK